MTGVRAARRLLAAAAAGAGALVTHSLVYRLLDAGHAGHAGHPHPGPGAAGQASGHGHEAAMAAVDHGYLEPVAVGTALLTAVALAVAVAAARRHRPEAARPARRLLAGVAGGSVVLFAVAEVAERLVAGAALGDLVGVLGLGLPLAALVAGVHLVAMQRSAQLLARRPLRLRFLWLVAGGGSIARPRAVRSLRSRPSVTGRCTRGPPVVPVLA